MISNTPYVNSSPFEKRIQKALTIYKDTDGQISNVDFCRDIFDFTETELNYLKMFWESTFNKSYIYLSDEIILDMLTDETGKNAVDHFIKRKLLKYEHGVDYIEIDNNDVLVQEYIKIVSPDLGNRKYNAKKYFKVTGECLKSLLMESRASKGKEIRKYYIKIENAAICMKEVIVKLFQLNCDRELYKMKQREQFLIKETEEFKIREDSLVRDKQELVNKLKNVTQVNTDLLEYKLHKDKNQTIYLISSRNYLRQMAIKVGLTKTNVNSRLSSLNTGHLSGDDLVVLYEIKTYCASTLEKLLHKTLESLRWSKNREFFICPYKLLKDYIESVAESHEMAFDRANDLIQTITMLQSETGLDSINVYEDIDMSIFESKPKVLKITFTDDETKDETLTFSKRDSSEKIYRDVQKLMDKYINRLIGDGDSLGNTSILDWNNFKEFMQRVSNRKHIPVPISNYKKAFKDILNKKGVKYNLRNTLKLIQT